MAKTDTPLTDKEAFSDSLMPKLQNVPVEFARRLERERSELIEALSKIADPFSHPLANPASVISSLRDIARGVLQCMKKV